MSANAVILLILLLVGCASAACLLGFALPNLTLETQALKECKDFFKEAKRRIIEKRNSLAAANTDKPVEHDAYRDFLEDCGRAEKDEDNTIRQWRHFEKAEDVPGAICVGAKARGERRSSYIADRLFVILCSVSTANVVRKVPTLTDLHELTQQQEHGEWTTATFRALTPSLLVIGILGTLIGVHHQLSNPNFLEGSIAQLGPALGPGILAVVGTIVCVLLRSRYNSRYAKFTKEIDEFTLEELLPFFRTKGELQVDVETFEENMEKIKTLDYGGLGKTIADYRQTVNDCHAVCKTLPELCGRNGLGRLIELEQSLQRSMKPIRQRREQLDQFYARYSNSAKTYAELSENAAARLNDLADSLAGAAEQEEQLDVLLSSEGADIDEQWLSAYIATRQLRDRMGAMRMPDHEVLAKQCESLQSWFRSDLQTSERQFAATAELAKITLDSIQEQLEPVSANARFIETSGRRFIKHLGDVRPLVTSVREKRLSAWRDGEATLCHLQEQYGPEWDGSRREGLYPKGWVGVYMRLRDALERSRRFFYDRWVGRVCGVTLLASFLAFLYWV